MYVYICIRIYTHNIQILNHTMPVAVGASFALAQRFEKGLGNRPVNRRVKGPMNPA